MATKKKTAKKSKKTQSQPKPKELPTCFKVTIDFLFFRAQGNTCQTNAEVEFAVAEMIEEHMYFNDCDDLEIAVKNDSDDNWDEG